MARLQGEGGVPLHLSPSWSDRDKASLHKVAGRRGAGAQRHSTCQQSHTTPGTHSSSHRLPESSFLYLALSVHSFIPPHLAIFLPFPFIIVSFSFSSLFFWIPLRHPPPPFLSVYLRESAASYFPPAFWDHAEKQAEPAVLVKSLVVLTEFIILLMFCHCCWALEREAHLFYMYVLRKVSKNRKKQRGCICGNIKT